jgi:hypothetical protein
MVAKYYCIGVKWYGFNVSNIQTGMVIVRRRRAPWHIKSSKKRKA